MSKKQLLIFIPLVAVLSTVIILLITLVTSSPKTDNINITATPKELLDQDQLVDNQSLDFSTFEFTVSGWIPNWGSPSGLNSLKNNPSLFNSISPVWYELNTDGSLKSKYPSNKKEMLAYLTENNIEIIPAIAMFDHELFTKVLQNEENLTRHINSIVSNVVDNDFVGIDLDYESTKLSDKDKYFEFLSRLSAELKKVNKKLIVTVVAKWGDNILYPSLVETRQVQDWAEIQKYADKIRIMAYDYTFIKSKYPGPIAPLNWIDEVLKYGVEKVDPQKLVLGIHLYAYEWIGSDSSKLPFIPSMKLNSTAEVESKAFTYTEVKNILKGNTGQSTTYESEQVFNYVPLDNFSRTLVYIDQKGVNDRINLAKKYNISGVVFWRIGGESDLLTNLDISN